MASYCNITFTVNTKNPVQEVYLVGNTNSLGAWNTVKAVKMIKVNENTFTITKRFNVNENVEYKVISTKNWENVEKGIFTEDVENHHFVAEKGHFENIFIHSFN
jgi:hypothetical protein